MTKYQPTEPGGADSFERIVEELVELIRQGKESDAKSLAAKYPSHAERIHGLVPTLITLEKIAPEESGEDLTSPPHPQVLGDFEIVREIGRGGMGIVYKAWQVSLGRTVAVKVLPFASLLGQHQLQRFQNEARAAATLKHPNIVGVHAVGCEGGIHYYAMEYVEGCSLATVIAQVAAEASNDHTHTISGNRESSLDESSEPSSILSSKRRRSLRHYVNSIAELGVQAAEALDHAHSLGIVHRDIKPSNLLIDQQGTLWITDFGLAQIEAAENLTTTGDILGTLRYMSPEQANGQRVLDARSDIFSLGVTLYELLTLKPAFDEKDKKKLIAQVRESEPVSPRKIDRQLPADLDRVIQKSIAQDPRDRYSSAREFAQDLQRFLTGRAPLAQNPSPYARTLKWANRNPASVAAGVIVMLVVLTTALITNSLLARAKWRAERASQLATEADKSSQEEAAKARLAASTTQAVNRFLTDFVLIRADPTQMSRGQDATIRGALDNAADYVEQWYPNDPDLRASLYRTIGQLYLRLGEYTRSVANLEKAQALFSTDTGQTEAQIDCNNSLGLALLKVNRAETAVRLLRSNLELSKSRLSDTHATTLRAMEYLAKVYLQLEQPEASEEMIRQCYDLCRESLGADSPEAATAAVTLSQLLLQTNRLEEAQSIIGSALPSLRRHLGTQSLDTQDGMHILAQIHEARNEYEQAESLYREVVRSRIGIQGLRHSLTLSAMADLLRVVEFQNRLPEAEALIEQMLQAQQLMSLDGSIVEHVTKGDLSRVLWMQGKLQEAASVFKTNDIVALSGKDQSADVALLYADTLLGLGKYQEAYDLLQATWDRVKTDLGENHPVCGLCLSRMVFAQFAQRKPVAGNQLAKANLPLFGPIMSDPTSGLAEVLALLYWFDRTPYPSTATFLRESLNAKMETLPEDHLSVALTQAVLGLDLISRNNPEQAEPILRACLKTRESQLPSENIVVAEAKSLLGHCLALLGRDLVESELLMTEALQSLENNAAIEAALKLEFTERLVAFYEVAGDADNLIKYQKLAGTYLRSCLDHWQLNTKPSDSFRLAMEAKYANYLIALEQFEEAEKLLLELCAISVASAPNYSDPYSNRTRFSAAFQAREYLAKLYRKWEKPGHDWWQQLIDTYPREDEFSSNECQDNGIRVWESVCAVQSDSLFYVRLARAYLDAANARFARQNLPQAIISYETARELIDKAVTEFEGSSLAREVQVATYASLANAYYEHKNFAQALECFETALKLRDAIEFPEERSEFAGITVSAHDIVFDFAWFLASAPDPFAAPSRALELLESMPYPAIAGLAYYRLGEYDQAISVLESEIPGKAGWAVWAMVDVARGDKRTARFHFETAVARFQNVLLSNYPPSMSQQFGYRITENLLALASKALGISSDQREALDANWKGMAFVEHGRIDEALQAFTIALALDQDYADPHLGLAYCYSAKGDSDKCANSIETYFAYGPDKPPAKAYVIRGSLLAERGKVDSAIDSLEKAVSMENEPDRLVGWAYTDLASLYVGNEDYQKARNAFVQATKKLPGESLPLANFARFMALCPDVEYQNLDLARQYANEAIESEPESAEALYTLATVQYCQGKFDEAETSITKAAEFESADTTIRHLLLALVRWKKKDEDDAARYLNQAHTIALKEEKLDPLLAKLFEEAKTLIGPLAGIQ